jgi:beta-ketodecanoyl-[acyl-carrier-protein] synthase
MVRAMSTGIAISGTGAWHPTDVITNEELCASFNEWVRTENERNAEAIEAGFATALAESTPEFIVKASGIRQRYVQDKEGILDVERMFPIIHERPEDELCLQADYGVHAAKIALKQAGRTGEEVDLIIVACAALQRYYPAIAVEIQGALGARGFAYDVLAGCSSATYPIQQAVDALRSGSATRALVINPELTTPFVNFRDRDSHFIFGDAATATLIEKVEDAREGAWEILNTKMFSTYSSNIRNNFGYTNRCTPETKDAPDKLFHQQGRRVFKDVVPLAAKFITDHLAENNIEPKAVKRYWLHQANINLNSLVVKRLTGEAATQDIAPLVLGDWGNTASAGSIIAFHEHRADLEAGSLGVLCSFGAGYSIGSVLVRKR